MTYIKRFIRQYITCRHTNKGQYVKTIYVNGYQKAEFYKRCKNCGRVWKL